MHACNGRKPLWLARRSCSAAEVVQTVCHLLALRVAAAAAAAVVVVVVVVVVVDVVAVVDFWCCSCYFCWRWCCGLCWSLLLLLLLRLVLLAQPVLLVRSPRDRHTRTSNTVHTAGRRPQMERARRSKTPRNRRHSFSLLFLLHRTPDSNRLDCSRRTNQTRCLLATRCGTSWTREAASPRRWWSTPSTSLSETSGTR